MVFRMLIEIEQVAGHQLERANLELRQLDEPDLTNLETDKFLTSISRFLGPPPEIRELVEMF